MKLSNFSDWRRENCTYFSLIFQKDQGMLSYGKWGKQATLSLLEASQPLPDFSHHFWLLWYQVVKQEKAEKNPHGPWAAQPACQPSPLKNTHANFPLYTFLWTLLSTEVGNKKGCQTFLQDCETKLGVFSLLCNFSSDRSTHTVLGCIIDLLSVCEVGLRN